MGSIFFYNPSFFQNSHGFDLLFHGFFQSSQSHGLLLLGFFENSMVVVIFFLAEISNLWFFFHGFFPKLPKPQSFFSQFFSKTPWLWSSSCQPKPQHRGLVLHGFFQTSQNLFLLIGCTFKAMVFFFLNFQKLPKLFSSFSWFFPKLPQLPKLCSSYSWFFFQNSMDVVFLFLVETSKSFNNLELALECDASLGIYTSNQNKCIDDLQSTIRCKAHLPYVDVLLTWSLFDWQQLAFYI